MMKADLSSGRKGVSSDDAILSAFDPVVEGASFQIFEEGLDPQEYARLEDLSEGMNAPEVLATFDLAETLARVPEKLFFRIGEVADLLEVKTYVLRFWETEFPMVSPSKSRSGQRVYRKKDVEMLLLIKHLLYVERFSIEGARKRIRELRLKPTDLRASKKPTSEPVLTAPVSASAPPQSGVSSSDRESLLGLIAEIQDLCRSPITAFFRF